MVILKVLKFKWVLNHDIEMGRTVPLKWVFIFFYIIYSFYLLFLSFLIIIITYVYMFIFYLIYFFIFGFLKRQIILFLVDCCFAMSGSGTTSNSS